MNTKKWLTTALATIAVAAGTVALTPAPSDASIAPCQKGVTCGYTGLSPVSTGCANGAYAVANTHVLINTGPTGNLNLMYSPTCNTNWVEADGLLYIANIVVWNEIGNKQHQDGVPSNGGWGYTPMVNGAYDAGGCIANYRFFLCVGQPNITSYPPYGSY